VRAAHANEQLPPRLSASTTYLGVSASLQWGAWAETGYFAPLTGVKPVGFTGDTTIAIYRTSDVPGVQVSEESVADKVAEASTPRRR
jgi:hypothetical protein